MARHYCAESPIVQRKPTPEEIRAAYGKTVPDIAPDCMSCSVSILAYTVQQLDITCASGKSLLAIAARRRLYSRLAHRLKIKPQFGYGMTNIVERATARADELDAEELVTGQQQLAAKVQHYRPQFWLFWGSVLIERHSIDPK